jgi:hypothetical protein
MSGEQQLKFQSELQHDLDLVEAVLRELPPAPKEATHVLIRCNAAQVDRAIARGFALAILYAEQVHLELIGDGDGNTTD